MDINTALGDEPAGVQIKDVPGQWLIPGTEPKKVRKKKNMGKVIVQRLERVTRGKGVSESIESVYLDLDDSPDFESPAAADEWINKMGGSESSFAGQYRVVTANPVIEITLLNAARSKAIMDALADPRDVPKEVLAWLNRIPA